MLSFQEQTPRDQITVPWDLTNHPLTVTPGALLAMSSRGSGPAALRCSSSSGFPRTVPMGTQKSAFPFIPAVRNTPQHTTHI